MRRRSTILFLIQVTLAATQIQERRRIGDLKAEKREQKAAWKKTSPLKKEKRGGDGKEEDIVARATKKADVCLLPVAQL